MREKLYNEEDKLVVPKSFRLNTALIIGIGTQESSTELALYANRRKVECIGTVKWYPENDYIEISEGLRPSIDPSANDYKADDAKIANHLVRRSRSVLDILK